MSTQQSQIAVALLAALTLPTMHWGRAESAKAPRPLPHAPSPAGTNWSWIGEKWDGNEEPYKTARAEIDRYLADRRSTNERLDQLKAAALKQPRNALAQFRWAYLGRQAGARIHDRQADVRLLTGVFEALGRAPSPHTYEYDRIRFLVMTDLFPEPALKPLGDRLLAHTPKDRNVEFNMVDLLDVRKPADRERALRYANELIAEQPMEASNHALLGSIYCDLWLKSRNKADADRAIAEYRRFLSLAGQNDPFRSRAKELISIMERYGGNH